MFMHICHFSMFSKMDKEKLERRHEILYQYEILDTISIKSKRQSLMYHLDYDDSVSLVNIQYNSSGSFLINTIKCLGSSQSLDLVSFLNN